jgi:hypothetical protein
MPYGVDASPFHELDAQVRPHWTDDDARLLAALAALTASSGGARPTTSACT